jgi:hypothetical protein
MLRTRSLGSQLHIQHGLEFQSLITWSGLRVAARLEIRPLSYRQAEQVVALVAVGVAVPHPRSEPPRGSSGVSADSRLPLRNLTVARVGLIDRCFERFMDEATENRCSPGREAERDSRGWASRPSSIAMTDDLALFHVNYGFGDGCGVVTDSF